MIHSQGVRFDESVCGVKKESTADTTIEDLQVVTDITNDYSKSLTDVSSEEVIEEVNDEQRAIEDCSEPVGGQTHELSTVRRSQRETRRLDFYGESVNTARIVSEPTTVEEAMSCPEKKNWKEAMDAEFQSLQTNEVWDLVTPPKGCKVINSKWVFKCKLGEHGEVERYKARLVAQGYSQRPGIDQAHTYYKCDLLCQNPPLTNSYAHHVKEQFSSSMDSSINKLTS